MCLTPVHELHGVITGQLAGDPHVRFLWNLRMSECDRKHA
jgi:hypothetical protein